MLSLWNLDTICTHSHTHTNTHTYTNTRLIIEYLTIIHTSKHKQTEFCYFILFLMQFRALLCENVCTLFFVRKFVCAVLCMWVLCLIKTDISLNMNLVLKTRKHRSNRTAPRSVRRNKRGWGGVMGYLYYWYIHLRDKFINFLYLKV